MARVSTQNSIIEMLDQRVYIGGVLSKNLWCTSVHYSAGMGASTATFTVPYAYANDPILNAYRYRKVIVIAGTGGSARTLFVGYISGDSSDMSESTDGVMLVAHTVGRFLSKHDVGEAAGHWRGHYRLFNDQGVPTGWTPLRVLQDLMLRLPAQWQTEVALGNVVAISDAQDLPVQGYDFSLTSYADAIDGIAASLGDVMVVEYFAYNITWLSFVMINAPNAPIARAKVARFTQDTSPNVARFSDSYNVDAMANQAIFFGTDREFLITCRSVVTGWLDRSEPPTSEGYYPTALIDDWDPELEAIALADPDLTKSDKTTRTCVVKNYLWANTRDNGDPNAGEGTSDSLGAPGTTGSTFYVKCGAPLVPFKTVLTHKSGERMLVRQYFPGSEADGTNTEMHATVHVNRLHQAAIGELPGDIQLEDDLQIEILGISNVFRRFKLPEILRGIPPKEFQSTIPWLDADGNRRPAQAFIFKEQLYTDPSDETKRLGIMPERPTLISGTYFDFENMRVRLGEPAVTLDTQEIVTVQNSDSAGVVKRESKRVKSTYIKTPCGVTFSYIDTAHPFYHATPVLVSTALPFITQSSRQKFDEYKYQQMTNTGFPIVDPATAAECVFQAILINPDSGQITNGFDVIRNDYIPLATAATRELIARYRVGYSATIEIPWVDSNYAIGQQLRIDGLDDPPKDRLTITGISYNMSPEGLHNTTIIADNQRPPKRQRFDTRLHGG